MTYEENIKRINKIAAQKGLKLNSDKERIKKVIGLMTENNNNFGSQFCPCKQINQMPQKGEDTICPCPELSAEIAEKGNCQCRIFYK